MDENCVKCGNSWNSYTHTSSVEQCEADQKAQGNDDGCASPEDHHPFMGSFAHIMNDILEVPNG